jgi:hypothetical protein
MLLTNVYWINVMRGLFNSFVEAKNLKNDDMEGECTYEASSIF